MIIPLLPPDRGPTGSPVTGYSIDTVSEQIVHHHRPTRPEFSDQIEYKKAVKCWRASGAWAALGPVTTTCRVMCEDGCEARSVWRDDRWVWPRKAIEKFPHPKAES